MKSAFTMIELVFSIVIIGVLSSIALIHIPAQRLDACLADYLASQREVNSLLVRASNKAFMMNKPLLDVLKEWNIPQNKIKVIKNGFLPMNFEYGDSILIETNPNTSCMTLIYKKLSYEDMYKINKTGNANIRSKLPKGEQHFYPNEPSAEWIKNNKDRI